MKKIKFSRSDEDVVWECQYCGKKNAVQVDLTVEGKQEFIEDCRVCDRPNRLLLHIEEESDAIIEARLIDE